MATDSSIYLKYIKEYPIEEKTLLLELTVMQRPTCEQGHCFKSQKTLKYKSNDM